jgi:hypothetical protein
MEGLRSLQLNCTSEKEPQQFVIPLRSMLDLQINSSFGTKAPGYRPQRLAMQMVGIFLSLGTTAHSTWAVPADIPEEMLQISMMEQAHSQLDGSVQTAQEQASEQQQLRVAPEDVPARLAPNVKQAVDLLRIRKLLKSLIPIF